MKVIIFFLTLITFSNAALNKKALEIYKFNVGTADSQLLVFPSGYSILIDAGEPSGASGTAGKNGKYLAKRLESILGKKKIDVFVLSHYHWDHNGGYKIGGIWYLIEKKGFTFGKFIKRNVGNYNGSSLSSCSKGNVKWNYVGKMGTSETKFVCYATATKAKTKLSKIGEVAHRCNTEQIHPPDEGAEVKILIRDALGVKDSSSGKKLARNSINEKIPVAENDFSICLRIVFGKFVYASCGDLCGYDHVTSNKSYKYHDIESLIAPMMGEVDLLHINHHGSKSSTNANWCNTLKPTVAVASCGDKSHVPVKQVMKNLYKVESQVYTTGLCNDGNGSKYYKGMIRMDDDVVITVPTNGTTFTVTNSKGGNKKEFNIKLNKTEPVACRKLDA